MTVGGHEDHLALGIDTTTNQLTLKNDANSQWCIYLSPNLMQHLDEDKLRVLHYSWHNMLVSFFHNHEQLSLKVHSAIYYNSLWDDCQFQTKDMFLQGVSQMGFTVVMDYMNVAPGHQPNFEKFYRSLLPIDSSKTTTTTSAVPPPSTHNHVPSYTRITRCLQNMIAVLNTHIYGRDQVIRLMLLSLLSGNHMLLLGPPGTGKSALATDLLKLIQRAKPHVDAEDFETVRSKRSKRHFFVSS